MLKKITTIILLCIAFANSFYLDSKYKSTIQVKAANVYANDTNVPMVYKFDLGTPARADGQDIVITTTNDVLVQRTISSVGDGSYIIYYKDPAQTTIGGGTELLVQWGGSSVNVANNVLLWQNCHGSTDDYSLIVHGEEASANLTDESGNYVSTDVGLTYGQTGKIGKAFKVNGGSSLSNWGDVSQLNSTQHFTMYAWVTYTDVAVVQSGFTKYENAGNYLHCGYKTATTLFFEPVAGSGYSSMAIAGNLNSGTPTFIAFVYDGTNINTDKALVFIDGVCKTDNVVGDIDDSTSDMSGIDFTIGRITTSLNAIVDEFRAFSGTLTENQIKTQYDNQNLFSVNGSITIGLVVSDSNLRKKTFGFGRSFSIFSRRKTKR